jgi:tRNA1(Val) A37 N6-methylase TrmN6
MDETGAPVTEDRILGGRVLLRQPAKGYRAGVDAALLAAACDARPGERVLEPGCGVGAVMLAAAARRPGARFLGLERDAEAVRLARLNLAANDLGDRALVLEGEIAGRELRSVLADTTFDGALCNPPFFDDPAQLRAPHPTKTGAWMADDGLAAWVRFLTRSVREGGTITLIHRADRLADLLALLAPKAGSIQIHPIYPFVDAPAGRVLVRAVKTGKAPLRLLPPLVLHERGGAKHSPEAEAILRGEADLPWL